MVRPPTITPQLRPGHRVYSAVFVDATGRRVARSLRTADSGQAGIIAASLTALRLAGVARATDAVGYAAPAVEIYFDLPAGEVTSLRISQPVECEAFTDAELSGLIGPVRQRILMLAARVGEAELQARQLGADLAKLQAEHAALKASAFARAVSAAQRCPLMAKAIELYTVELSHATPLHAKKVISIVKRFTKQLPPSVRTPADIEAQHVGTWIAAQCQGAPKPAVRRKRLRVQVGQFVRWAARTWGFVSPMEAVAAPTASQVGRERRGAPFHTVEQIEAAIEGLKEPYWKALVAVFGFAGLQLEELVWLRREDYFVEDGKRYLRVQPADYHDLKTRHRERVVPVSKRLAGYLDAYTATNWPTVACLFPMPEGMRRRVRKKTPGSIERWTPHQLSVRLNGTNKNSKLARVLPEGMSAMSLRRSFSNNLNVDIIDRAAVLGNDPATAARHYTKSDSRKVDTDV